MLRAFGTQIGPPDRFDRHAGRASPLCSWSRLWRIWRSKPASGAGPGRAP